MPQGIPRWIRVWDSGPDENDRYTVCYTGRYRQRGIPKHTPYHKLPWFQYVGMSADPRHICMHGESQTIIDCPHGWTEQVGRICRHNPNLGRRIRFEDLPADCQKVVLRDYCELWSLPEPKLD
jgi:hypothetical protein